jgi:nickel-dependent lactate racemase
MHKTKGSEFMKVAREFTLKGGTMIMLAHANKNRGMDGKIVAGGTSDIGDDCDCVYLLDEVSRTATTKTVLFENAKKRGNNTQEMSFSYALSGENYGELLASVKPLDFETIERTKRDFIINARLEKDKHAIEAITEGIKQGHNKRTDLVQFAMDKNNYGVPRQKVWDVLDRYTGEKLNNSSLWRVQIGDKNAKNYYLLTEKDSFTDYEKMKNGY